MDESDNASIRADKWLWHARFCKTRATATTLIRKGRLRVDGDRVRKASRLVRVGQVLTFPFGDEVCTVEVMGLGDRRGPFEEAQTLYRKVPYDE